MPIRTRTGEKQILRYRAQDDAGAIFRIVTQPNLPKKVGMSGDLCCTRHPLPVDREAVPERYGPN